MHCTYVRRYFNADMTKQTPKNLSEELDIFPLKWLLCLESPMRLSCILLCKAKWAGYA